jgi:SAM-dependent methyltransferase
MPLYKYVGNKVLSTFENRVVGTDLTEWHSGYRAYSVDTLRSIPFEENSDDYDFDTGIILQCFEAGRYIVEIPIPTFYGDEISYVNGMRYAKDIVGDVLRYRAHKLGLGIPAGEVGEAAPSPSVVDGPDHRLAAWALARPPGRVLLLDGEDGVDRLRNSLEEAGHEVQVVKPGSDDAVDATVLEALTADGTGFDAIVATGLLERSIDPGVVLRGVAGALRPGGVVALAVPNVAHWYPRTRMAVGRFRYERDGALASRNLRFFTRQSVTEALAAAGLRPRRWEAMGVTDGVAAGPKSQWSGRVDALGLALRPELFAATWLVEAEAEPAVEDVPAALGEPTAPAVRQP